MSHVTFSPFFAFQEAYVLYFNLFSSDIGKHETGFLSHVGDSIEVASRSLIFWLYRKYNSMFYGGVRR